MVAKTTIAETLHFFCFFFPGLLQQFCAFPVVIPSNIWSLFLQRYRWYIVLQMYLCLYIHPCVSATFDNFSADGQAWCILQFYPEWCFAVFLFFKRAEFTQTLIWSISGLKKNPKILKLRQFLGEEKLEKMSEMEAVQKKKAWWGRKEKNEEEKNDQRKQKKHFLLGSDSSDQLSVMMLSLQNRWMKKWKQCSRHGFSLFKDEQQLGRRYSVL